MSLKYTFQKYVNRKNPIILAYHAVCDDERFPLFSKMSVDRFCRHMEFLSENYNCISLSEFYGLFLKNEIDPYTVVVTFDDGYANNYYKAFPALEQFNIPATIFLATSLIGTKKFIWPDIITAFLFLTVKVKVSLNETILSLSTVSDKVNARNLIVNFFKKLPCYELPTQIERLKKQLAVNLGTIYNNETFRQCFGMLSWSQVNEMQRSALIKFGSHGMTHRILTRIPDKDALWEIQESKKILETRIGNTVDFFAYPNGSRVDFSQFHYNTLKDTGYRMALTTIEGYVSGSSDIYEFPRFCVPGQMEVEGLRYLLTHTAAA